ncbi:MAG: hypothetical protein WB784_11405 [Rhodanobacteraceae bacterium]
MISNRFIEHVRQQRWAGVFIELFIVVFGVFIGIQASNWNTAREEKIKGGEVAQRLLQDLRVDLRDREHMVAYYRAVDSSAEKTVALLKSPAPDPKALVVNAFRATEYNYFPTTRATWDEVISSGELGTLPRRLDMSDISNFFNYDSLRDDSNNMVASPYRMRVRRIIPHAVQQAIRAGCSDRINQLGYVVGFKPDCQLTVSDAEITAGAAALRNDPELLPDLRLHFSVLTNARNDLGSDVIILRRAIASFDGKAAQPEAGKP